MKKKKITVIGGGLGAMTSVCQLMQQPNAADLYEIDIYQMGWRLGGKGTSGVNPEKGYRVEEHGIHFWFGFYENAFALMREVYGGLDRPPEAPLANFHKAFKPQPYMVFTEHVDNNWVDWKIPFPKLPGKIGDGQFNDPVEEIFVAVFNYLAMEIRKHFEGKNAGCLGELLGKVLGRKSRHTLKGPLEQIVQGMEKKIEADVVHDIEKHLRVTGMLLANAKYHGPEHVQTHLDNINNLEKWIWDLIGELVHTDNLLRRLWTTIDFSLAFVRGMITDGVVSEKDGKLVLDFTLINEYDYKDWLVLHGMDPEYAAGFPPVKSMYDGPFAFFRGNVEAPNIEAGTALNIFLRLAITCKEAVMWRMQAGMGDTIFAPFYLWLKKHFPDNVRFHFFHKATHLQLSKDKQRVDSIAFEQQVQLRKGLENYDPLIPSKGGLLCWPSHPVYEQLDPKQAKALQKEQINLESNWSGWKQGQTVNKRLGVDFDEVIIGASLASLPDFCSEMINHNPAWSNMLDKVGTVQTQAFQLWLTKDPKELGADPQKILSCYVEPVDTFAEMNQVLDREKWDNVPEKPKYLAYVCGAFEDAGKIPPYSISSFPQNQEEEVYGNMKHYIENYLQHVLPDAFDASGKFDWNILIDANNGIGEDRLRYQYWRANIDPSERYVFSLVGSSKYRLQTDESGFSNVFLTGDWIQNGFNIGFVEGAVISGILTARAVSGNPDIPIFVPW